MSAVLSHAGAAPRDSVDALVLAQASSFGLLGELYRDQNETGLPNDGYGEIAGGAPLPPAAGGFPLAWAAAYGVSPTDPSAGNAPFAGTEYTVVEAWVNSLVLPHPWTSPLPPGVDGGTAGGVFFNPLVDSGGWLLAAGEGGGRCAVAPVGSPTAGSVSGVLAVVNGTGGVLLAALRTRVTLTATAGGGGGGGGQLTLTWTTPSSPDPQVAVAPWDGSLPLSLRLTWVGGVVGAQAALPGGGWVAVGGVV